MKRLRYREVTQLSGGNTVRLSVINQEADIINILTA